MKKTKILTLVASAALVNWVAAESPRTPTKPERPEKPSEEKKGAFGEWLDKDGFITDGPKIKNWIDTDGDRIDDRMQNGTYRRKPSDKEILRPNKPDQEGEKPEKLEDQTLAPSLPSLNLKREVKNLLFLIQQAETRRRWQQT